MILAVLLVVFGSIALAALITPPIYIMLGSIMSEEMLWPFSRVFDRIAMACVLGFVLVLRKHFPLRDMVEVYKRGDWKSRTLAFRRALYISTVTSLFVFGAYVSFDVLHAKETLSTAYVFSRIAKAIGTGIIVSLIEESFFRAMLFPQLIPRVGAVLAAVITSLVYSGAHFVAPVKTWKFQEGSWFIGFDYLSAVLSRAWTSEMLLPFLGLFLVGLVLAHIFYVSRNIYLCLGLHTGWVFILKCCNYFTYPAHEELYSGAGRNFFFVAQPATWIAIIVCWGWIYYWLSRSSRAGLGTCAQQQ